MLNSEVEVCVRCNRALGQEYRVEQGKALEDIKSVGLKGEQEFAKRGSGE